MACPGRLELPTCWFEASRSAPTELRAGIWCCGQPPIALFRHANIARLPLTLAEKPGFEPGRDLRPARLANECLRPLGHFSVKWGEPPDSNRHRPGSRPGALPIKLGTPLFGGGWRDRTPTPFRASRFSRPISTPALRASVVGADSRSRSDNLQGGSLSLCLLSYAREIGLEGRIRTCGLPLPKRVLYYAELLPGMWWTETDSNGQPRDYRSRALPAELSVRGDPDGIRTRNLEVESLVA